MILFDPDQPEAAEGFPQFAVVSPSLPAGASSRSALPTKRTLTRYLREAKAAVGLKGEVSVLLTTDTGIRGLNRRFRKKNKATDVLSFPVEDGSSGLAGDLAISVETAARQAQEQGHGLSVELRVLMLHGLLHLAGYDHESDDGEMARKERRLRAKLRLPQGLIERVSVGAAKKRREMGGRGGKRASGAKAPVESAGQMYGLKSVPSKAPGTSPKPVISRELVTSIAPVTLTDPGRAAKGRVRRGGAR
jgi:probable rRNA maturation factor